jgi:hypothetical protein
MLKWVPIICAALFAGSVHARSGSSDSFVGELQILKHSTHYSLTRQFVIISSRDVPNAYARMPSSATNLVRLDPNFLAVSCERIKKALLAELGAPDRWRGKISLQLHSFNNAAENVVITSTKYGDRWSYWVDLPDRIEKSRLVATVVEMLLLEMANRDGADRSAEIPAWLSQGLAEQLLLSTTLELVVQPPTETESGVTLRRLFHDDRRANPLAQAHDELLNTAPLTLEELSWPGDRSFTGDAGQAYRSCAQVFVVELLRLNNGRSLMHDFITELPHHLNWQISFLKAYQSRFSGLRDLEKWWALRMVNFIGRDLSRTWPGPESLRKLDEVIRPTVQVRTAVDQLPMRTEVTLQTIIRDWDFLRQSQMLQTKLQQLALLRNQVSPEVVPLVDSYRKVLEVYLRNRTKAGFTRLVNARSTPGLDRIAQPILQELDRIDTQRDQLRPTEEPVQSVKSETVSNFTDH